jgi:predicted PurR-regulated permease PerM
MSTINTAPPKVAATNHNTNPDRRIQQLLWGLLPLAVILYFMWYFQNIVLYLLLAIILSYIINPLVNVLAKINIKKNTLPRWLLTLVAFAALFGLIYGFFALFAPLIGQQWSLISKTTPEQILTTLNPFLQKIEKTLVSYHIIDSKAGLLAQTITQKIYDTAGGTQVQSMVQTITNAAGSLVFGMFAVFFMTFFIVKERSLLRGATDSMLPDRYTEPARKAFTRIEELLSRYFLGIIAQSTIVGTLIALGMWALGIKNAVLIGVFAGVINVVPYIGPVTGFAFALFVGVTTNLNLDFDTQLVPLLTKMSAVLISVQLLDNWIVQPIIFSKTVNAHPLEIFIVVLMGSRVGGAFGMFLAIPVYTILRVTAREFFMGFQVVRKMTKNIYGDETPEANAATD